MRLSTIGFIVEFVFITFVTYIAYTATGNVHITLEVPLVLVLSSVWVFVTDDRAMSSGLGCLPYFIVVACAFGSPVYAAVQPWYYIIGITGISCKCIEACRVDLTQPNDYANVMEYGAIASFVLVAWATVEPLFVPLYANLIFAGCMIAMTIISRYLGGFGFISFIILFLYGWIGFIFCILPELRMVGYAAFCICACHAVYMGT